MDKVMNCSKPLWFQKTGYEEEMYIFGITTENLQKVWLKEFFETVKAQKPTFLALHCQECGGKSLESGVTEVKRFVKELMAAQELKDYSRARVYIDESYESPERFTALGCFYFIHDSLKNVLEYNFEDARFHKVTGKEIRSIKQCKSPMAQKEKFPANFFEQCQWSRKGFIRTRWSLSSCNFDLVNVHLFHDAHNVVAWKESPSYYAGIRRKAMDFVLHRISDEQHEKLPFFLFGDFNFRLDTRELFEHHLCYNTKLETITNSNNEVDKIRYREIGNDQKVILEVEKKSFNFADPNIFQANNGTSLLEYDKELGAFRDQVDEMEITFPPTYPYSEDVHHAKQYNTTRCPAWCDRILLSISAKHLMAMPKDKREEEEQENDENSIVYDNIGPNVCMGDHKPVFLSFRLPAGKGNSCQREVEHIP
ncbi:type I inositol 1,4,5-trisphosphate 5-phosphatase isoform X3 [Poecilia latipinna]|uniref:type I inositol 1,4,5-trisphosphate 5-phosphatase isoform X3 n=2 Tax=Poecilia TaxID=8080 RepID=UPI00072ECFAB|nr:PREDICTED: type I inositol 1,4,5-trisphosphate 5-phosphatase isoform X3 [Poecilia latipinna]